MVSAGSGACAICSRRRADEIAAALTGWAPPISPCSDRSLEATPPQPRHRPCWFPGGAWIRSCSMGAMIDELTVMLGVKADVITHAILDARGRGEEDRCRRICRGGVRLAEASQSF